MNTSTTQSDVDFAPFTDLTRNVASVLKEMADFISHVHENPLDLFTGAKSYLGENLQIFNTILFLRPKGVDLSASLFQQQLASVLDSGIKGWAKEKGLTFEPSIAEYNPNRVPSPFVVRSGDIDLVQFDICEAWYAVCGKVLTEDELSLRVKAKREPYLDYIERLGKRLYRLESIRKSPISHVKSLRELFTVLFRKRTLQKNLNEIIDKATKEVVRYSAIINEVDNSLPYLVKRETMKKVCLEQILPFFKEINYTEVTKEFSVNLDVPKIQESTA